MNISLVDAEYYVLNSAILGYASLLFYGIHKLIRTSDLGSVNADDPAPLLISLALLTWMVAVLAAFWMKLTPLMRRQSSLSPQYYLLLIVLCFLERR